MNEDTYGTLIIAVFVASHRDQHQGRARRLATIRCQFGEAAAIWKAWRENNTALKAGYNSSLCAEFRPDSVGIA